MKISQIQLNAVDFSNHTPYGLRGCQVFQELEAGTNTPLMRFWVRHKDFTEDYGPFSHPYQASSWIKSTHENLRKLQTTRKLNL